MNVYEARVPLTWSPVRVSRYLARAFPLLPEHVVREALKNRDVKLNGRRVSGEEQAVPGAQVQLYTPFEARLPVVYQDERVMLVNKPAGLSCDEDDWGGMTALSFARRQTGTADCRLCHRLDNQTCGLLLFALDEEAEQCLLSAFEERRLDKRYQCLVKGTMRPAAGESTAFLVKDARLGRVRVVSHETPEGRTIRTAWETVAQEGDVTRLSVHLLTGRTHQIRAHLTYLAHPVVGDDVYGDRAFNRRHHSEGSLRLCACQLTLWAGGPLSYLDGRAFTVPVPF